MGDFFVKDYTGDPFVLFDGIHVAALTIILLLNVALIRFGRRLPPRGRMLCRYAMASVLLTNETLWHLWNWTTGQWSIQTMLPLHLCSVLVFLTALMLVVKSYPIYEFAYLLGIAGALQALLTPDAGIYGFPHFRFFQVFVSHGLIVTAAVYMTTVEGFRPYPKSILRVILMSNVYMAFVGVINTLIGSNYLYIAHKPETASLLDVLPAWPWYIFYIEFIGLVCMMLLYLPFAVQDIRERQIIHRAAN